MKNDSTIVEQPQKASTMPSFRGFKIMSSLTKARPQRLTFLDSIRGLAALSVVWSHFALGYGALVPLQTALEHTPLHLFWDGSAAVSMFFVLSGFVLSLKYLQQPDFKAPIQLHLPSFYISRICRISLPFMAMLGISYGGCHWFYHHPVIEPPMTKWLQDFWTPAFLAATSSFFKQALLFLPDTIHFYIPQGWTLTLELQASLCMPFLILVARRNQIFLMIICIFSIGYDLFLNNNLTVSMYILLYFHFYLGILLSSYLPVISRWGSERSSLAKWLLFCSAVFFYAFRYTIYVRYPEIMRAITVWYFTALGSFMFLLLLMGSSRSRKLLDYAPFRNLGKISYSLYLCHLLVLLILVPGILSLLNRLGLVGGLAHYTAFFLTTLLALGFSIIFYVSIEKPAMNLGHRLARIIAVPRFLKRSINSELKNP